MKSCGAWKASSKSGVPCPKALPLALLLLGACATEVQPAQVTQTPTKEPTAVVHVADPSTATPGPITQTTPGVVLEPAELLPTGTPVLSSVDLPESTLHIFEPGPGSQVRSPIRVVGWGGPSFNNAVRVELFGEDGRSIARRFTYIMAIPEGKGRFVIELDFETPLVAEAARLVVSTHSSRYRQLDELTSVEIVLLSAGTELIHPSMYGSEKLAIFAPREGMVVQGGVVQIRGAGWVDTESPLILELIDRNDEVLASREVFLDPHEPGTAGEFSAELPYQIPFSQYARVVLREMGTKIPGITHYSSVEVYLRR